METELSVGRSGTLATPSSVVDVGSTIGESLSDESSVRLVVLVT